MFWLLSLLAYVFLTLHVVAAISVVLVSAVIYQRSIYIRSIQSYFYNDDTFNFNYGQAKAAIGNFKEAEEVRCKGLLWDAIC